MGVQRYVRAFDCCGCGGGGLVKNALCVHAANERVAEFIYVHVLGSLNAAVYVSCVFFWRNHAGISGGELREGLHCLKHNTDT
jgi:hypothetical protein